jgi:hypothetical protein
MAARAVLRPTVAAPTSRHRGATGKSAGDVVVRVVVATGAGSRPDNEPSTTSGAIIVGWHRVADAAIVVGGHRRVVVDGDFADATDGSVVSNTAYVLVADSYCKLL